MQQLAQERYGNDAVKTILAWRQMILTNQNHTDKEALEILHTTNIFFNQRIHFNDDQKV